MEKQTVTMPIGVAMLLGSFGIYGVVRLIQDLLHHDVITPDHIEDIVGSILGEMPRGAGGVPKEIILRDTDTMRRQYERYGREGLYAYLIFHGIAKDSRHGDYLMDHEIIPLLEKEEDDTDDLAEAHIP